MIDVIYTFYNTLSKRYGGAFTAETDAVMIRNMAEKLPDYMEVCKVGTIDLSTGMIDTHAPVRVDVPRKEVTIADTEKALANE